MLTLVLLATLGAAPDCPPDAPVTLKVARGTTAAQLAAWASANLCASWSADDAVAKRTSPVALTGTLKRSAARLLFSALLSAMELGQRHDLSGSRIVERPAPPPDACAPELRAAVVGAVRTVSPTEHVVSRAGLEALGTACLTREARLVPNLKAGAVRGLKVFGLRPGGLGLALGFQNGDTVLEVNGRPLTSPDAALEAWQATRHAKLVRFAVERRGAPTELLVRLEGVRPPVPDAGEE